MFKIADFKQSQTTITLRSCETPDSIVNHIESRNLPLDSHVEKITVIETRRTEYSSRDAVSLAMEREERRRKRSA